MSSELCFEVFCCELRGFDVDEIRMAAKCQTCKLLTCPLKYVIVLLNEELSMENK